MRCPNCHRKISRNNTFCPYCGTTLQSNQVNYQQPMYPKKHHHIIEDLIIAILLMVIVAGGIYMYKNYEANHTQQSSQMNNKGQSNQSSNDSGSSESSITNNDSSNNGNGSHGSEPTNKPGYTLSVFPADIRGTWYSDDWGHMEKITITANTITDDGHTSVLHSRSKNTDPMKASKHNNWIVSVPGHVNGIHLTNVRSWNQSAGDGADYGVIHADGMTILDVAGGAAAATDSNFYQTKAEAQQNKKRIYKSAGEHK